jgi:FkbM family methyltransferase
VSEFTWTPEEVLAPLRQQGECHHLYNLTKKHIRNFRTAIDIGSKFGHYSKELVKDFASVHAFDMRAKMRISRKNLKFHNIALGDSNNTVYYTSARVNEYRGENTCKQKKLDDMSIQNVDHIKIDVEGHELLVLRGAVKTIKNYKPVITIEQNTVIEQEGKGSKWDGIQFLKSMGYWLVDHNGRDDYILIHP